MSELAITYQGLAPRPIRVAFTKDSDSRICSQTLSLQFANQGDAETAARILMMRLMQGISLGEIGPVARIGFERHDSVPIESPLPSNAYNPSREIPLMRGGLSPDEYTGIRKTASEAALAIESGLVGQGVKPDYVVIDGPKRRDMYWPDNIFEGYGMSQVRLGWWNTEEGYRVDFFIWDPLQLVGNDPPPFANLAKAMRVFCLEAGGTLVFDEPVPSGKN